MSINIRTEDGKKILLKAINKHTTVEELKCKVEEQLNVKKYLQRLFFSGKQLENGYHLDNYNINFNDTILLMVKTVVNDVEYEESTKEEKVDEEKVDEEKELEKALETKLEKTESLYYKIDDAVDCMYEKTGAWYEAIIKNIYKKEGQIFYEILWEFDNTLYSENIPEIHIRPRAQRSIPFDELSVDQKVMINYNLENAKKIGLWFDFTITEIIIKRTSRELVGLLHISTHANLRIRKRVREEDIYAIEAPKLLTERTAEDERLIISNGKRRPTTPNCDECEDNPDEKCQACGCKICAGKEEENTLLICDECDDMFHMKCLNPPLLELPEETYWYCPECKNDENEIVKAGGTLKKTKKRLVRPENERNWGGGMACVRRQTVCYIVPTNHSGPIPGVDVGTTWKYRIQVSEAGVHRPPVAGIHGRPSDCAYSIVLSGGYEEDYDNGDEFLYSGSGGRDLSGNKRTNTQSKDQELDRLNLALAMNCNAPVNTIIGASANENNWKKGKPVRVIRNYKLGRFSKYAPKEGNRYDGIYKVVKYYPNTSNGLRIWKFVLKRDDPIPAPWTKEGKKRIEFLGLKMLYPDGSLDQENSTKNKISTKKRSVDDSEEEDIPLIKRLKKSKSVFCLEDELKDLIENDKVNVKLWDECKATLINGKPAFLNCVSERFKCVCCLGILYNPVTTPCEHNICLKCLKQSFDSKIYFCPTCRYSLGNTYDMEINKTLSSALLLIYPGYKGEQ